jgi:hypothetical protein
MDDQDPNRKAAHGTAFPEAYEHLPSTGKAAMVRAATVINTFSRFGVTARLPLPVRS